MLRTRPRLPLRSVILLALAAGMLATAIMLASLGGGQETPSEQLGGVEGSTPALPQEPSPSQEATQDAPQGGAVPFATTLVSGRLELELLIVPAQAGVANQVHVTGLVPDGNLAEIQDLVVTLHPPDGSAPADVPMQRLAGNHLLATDVAMATPGTWRMELGMRVRETDIEKTRTIDPFHDVALATEIPVG